MKSIQFGHGSHKLYGVYHSPGIFNPNRKSILFCSSIGPEYMLSYRLIRMISEQLAKKGHHVFRFDWYGCGDSWGESSEVNTGDWILDVKLACKELADLSGNQDFSVAGVRLGASMALIALADAGNLRSLLLWEPVINGASWVSELETLHSLYLSRSSGAGRFLSKDELLGFPFSDPLKNEVCSINISRIKMPECKKIHLIHSGKGQKYDLFCKSFPFSVSEELIDASEIWNDSMLDNRLIMSHPVAKSIVAFFDRIS